MDRIIALILLAVVSLAGSAHAAENAPWLDYIPEATERFGIPKDWVQAVIATESHGDTKAVSPKGAMGLMQLMPGTWEDLRSTHALGADPFDPRANIMAGTAFLKALYDRFGYPDLFAAYNAGPARFEEHLRTGSPLPDETRSYTASIEKALSGTPILSLKNALSPLQIASGTGLFFSLSTAQNDARNEVNSVPSNDLFVRLSTQKTETK
jgi:soluble lytic murein transglycosylase-like protein